MADEQLGKALSAARKARGLTLHDVERDTRISQKYLKALEEDDLDILPAPVYARAFTRTYAQYLGLNANQLVQRLPGARPEPDLPPLPQVGREATQPLMQPSWMIAGVVVLVIFIAGMVIFWNRGGGGGDETVIGQPTTSGQGAENVTPPVTQQAPVDIEQGVVPDVRDENILVAIQALQNAEVPYLIVELENGDVPEQTVFNQSPSPGTEAEGNTVVTLMVSR
jgi:hypothetical protein